MSQMPEHSLAVWKDMFTRSIGDRRQADRPDRVRKLLSFCRRTVREHFDLTPGYESKNGPAKTGHVYPTAIRSNCS
jgi:hypothetical protein